MPILENRWQCFIPDPESMEALGKVLGTFLKGGTTVYLSGELGAGKTTLTRGLLRGWGFEEKVKSPTYTLVEPYFFHDKTLYHFDLYRLTDPHELEFMGARDYFTPSSICLIEWPEKGIGFLPPADLSCHIEFHDDGRQVFFEGISAKGIAIIKDLINTKLF